MRDPLTIANDGRPSTSTRMCSLGAPRVGNRWRAWVAFRESCRKEGNEVVIDYVVSREGNRAPSAARLKVWTLATWPSEISSRSRSADKRSVS